MTRRKGERTDKHRDQSHPFQVALSARSGSAGHAVMSRWAAWYDHETTNIGRDGACWCFCRAEVADAFAQDFGGQRVDRPVNPHRLAVDIPDAKELLRRAKAAWIGMEIVTGGRCFGISAPLRGAEAMPFSSLSSPEDIARCHAVLERAWAVVAAEIPEAQHHLEKTRLAFIVAAFFRAASDEDDLIRRSIERFHNPRSGRDVASELSAGRATEGFGSSQFANGPMQAGTAGSPDKSKV